MGRYSANNKTRQRQQVESAYQRVSDKSKRKPRRSNANRKVMLISICCVAAVVLIGIIIGCIYLSGTPNNGLILNNIFIAGVDVGGMSKEDAMSAVNLATKDTYTKKTMVVSVQSHTAELSPQLTGARLDVEGAVNAAYEYGRTGSRQQQKRELAALETAAYHIPLEPYLNLDSDAIKVMLNGLGSHFVSTLSQSVWNVETVNGTQSLVVKLGTPEYALDLQQLYNQVMDAYSSNVFQFDAQCPTKYPDPIDLDAIYAEYCTAPVDAVWDAKTGTYTEDVDGFGFDLEDTKKLLTESAYGTTVTVTFRTLKADVTVESLSASMFPDTLGSWVATDKTSDKNRNENLKRACELINGMILEPGQQFSYNEALGPRTKENGFKIGPSYAGDETEYTYGGGICQVSSALYYCTLQAELQIDERHAHRFAPVYVPLGMDATVSWDYLDFKFTNNTDSPIKIYAVADGGSVTVKLLSADKREYTVKLEDKVISSTPYSTTYKTMSENNPEGYRNGDVITPGYTGYVVETYRIKYNKSTGLQIQEDEDTRYITTSTYKSRDEVKCKIEGSTTTTPTPGPGGPVTDGNGSLPDE